MAKALVIVESPTKAKTINKYLGRQYIVKASLGHIKDLPKKDLAVDIEHDFEPRYEVIEGKKKLISELKQTAKNVENVYLAADPDREGEAICFHLKEELRNGNRKKGPQIYRVMFNEITKRAIQNAFEKPGDVNVHLVDAQQARRVLDRIHDDEESGLSFSCALDKRRDVELGAGNIRRVHHAEQRRICVDQRQNRIHVHAARLRIAGRNTQRLARGSPSSPIRRRRRRLPPCGCEHSIASY